LKKGSQEVNTKMHENLILSSEDNYPGNTLSSFSNQLAIPLMLTNEKCKIALKRFSYTNEYNILFTKITLIDTNNDELNVEDDQSKTVKAEFDILYKPLLSSVKDFSSKISTATLETLNNLYSKLNIFSLKLDLSVKENSNAIIYILDSLCVIDFNNFNKLSFNQNSSERKFQNSLHSFLKSFRNNLYNCIRQTYINNRSKFKIITKNLYLSNTDNNIQDYTRNITNQLENDSYLKFNTTYLFLTPINNFRILEVYSNFKVATISEEKVIFKFEKVDFHYLKDLYVYTDITGTDLFDKKYILKVINNRNKKGYIDNVYDHLTFIPISKTFLSVIKIDIRDKNNNSIEFTSSPTSCEIIIKNE
jgi:hypothetical protein